MKKYFLVLCLTFFFYLFACIPMALVESEKSMVDSVKFVKTILVKNYDGENINNAVFSSSVTVMKNRISYISGNYNIKDEDIGYKEIEIYSDEDGFIRINEKIPVIIPDDIKDWNPPSIGFVKYSNENKFLIEGEITAENYYVKSIDDISTSDVYLINKDNHDYYDKSFLDEYRNDKLKNKIDSFLGFILLQGYLSDCNLEIHSICMLEFKEKNYIKLSFYNFVEYNSVKLNKYDVGKNIYDSIVRKMLNNLVAILDDNRLYGANISIKSHIRDFVNNNKSETIIYQYIMPKESIIKYKNMDISGQNLLDSSYILMDNERIELKLQ